MHNPLPTAIEKQPNSRHVEIIISHDFISANHAALFSRNPPAIGELTRKNTRFLNGTLAAAMHSSWNFADLAGQAFDGYASYPPLMQVSQSHGIAWKNCKRLKFYNENWSKNFTDVLLFLHFSLMLS